MKKLYIILMVALGVVSCENYLDINTDPNSVSKDDVTASILFPAVEMNICASYNNFLQITGAFYAQHYGHSFGTSNYLDYSQFTMSATRSSTTYSQLTTRGLNNIATILEKAEADEDMGTILAATTLRAFIYQVLVDAYGEIPYSESLDIENLSPKYDEGVDIYYGILAELDAALANVTDASLVCDNFLFGTSDVQNWISFAKALKLRILMRMSGVESVQSQLDALVAEDDFPTSDVAFANIWSDESGKANPFYQEEFATYFGSTQVNCIANVAVLRTMEAVGDARQSAFFVASEDFGFTYGGVSGSNFSTGDIGSADLCRPNVAYNTPAVLISVCETEFLLAEYYAAKGSSAAAQEHYEAAITASFAMAGVSGASSVYNSSAYKWSDANAVKIIGIQKWVALSGFNSFEAWCELRRLGYPAFSSITGEDIFSESDGTYDDSSYTPGTLYTPTKVDSEVGSGKTIQRFKYPESSTSTNANSPAQKLLSVPVFWAE
ncbi:MAG: SusD/RagB family nutrient-binding outer membrane lipoprotein [Rikenellaceae bacterium]